MNRFAPWILVGIVLLAGIVAFLYNPVPEGGGPAGPVSGTPASGGSPGASPGGQTLLSRILSSGLEASSEPAAPEPTPVKNAPSASAASASPGVAASPRASPAGSQPAGGTTVVGPATREAWAAAQAEYHKKALGAIETYPTPTGGPPLDPPEVTEKNWESYNATLKSQPSYANLSQYEKDQLMGKIRDLEDKLKSSPDDLKLLQSLSQAQTEAQLETLSLMTLKTALDKYPTDENLLMQRARISHRYGMRQEAEEYYGRALKANPQNKEAKQGIAAVQARYDYHPGDRQKIRK